MNLFSIPGVEPFERYVTIFGSWMLLCRQKDVLVSPPKLRIGSEGLEPSKSKKQKSSGKKKHEKSGDLQIVALDELPRREHLDGGVSTITEKKKKKKKKGSAEQTRADTDTSPSKEANALEITPSKRRYL